MADWKLIHRHVYGAPTVCNCNTLQRGKKGPVAGPLSTPEFSGKLFAASIHILMCGEIDSTPPNNKMKTPFRLLQLPFNVFYDSCVWPAM
jgi:hypothetical protein